MRYTLFRGKRIDNGEWIEGSLLVLDECTQIVPRYSHYEYGELMGAVDVNPDTVGEFTGVMDKNNQKIFEDDIVRYEINSGMKNGAVIFSDQCFMPLTFCNLETVMVIGNIYDHPMLVRSILVDLDIEEGKKE